MAINTDKYFSIGSYMFRLRNSFQKLLKLLSPQKENNNNKNTEVVKICNEIELDFRKLDEILKHNVSHWDDTKRNNQDLVDSCNKKSNGDYVKFMVSELSDRLNTSEKDLLDYLKNVDIDKEENREKKNFIVKLRLMFSDISLKRLDPDLIIMDEFQRFKYLLNSKKDSEMGKIINKFFNNENIS